MKLLIVLFALVVAAAAQFNQGRFFNAPQARQSFPSNRRAFIRFDDDFDDFFDDDDDDDSLEDLYEDLYDDDADDRAEARAALTRLRASGAITGNAFRNNRFITNRRNNAFRSTGFTNRRFVNRFNNRDASTFNNRFNRPRPTTSFGNTFTPAATPTPTPTPSPFRTPFSNNNINSFRSSPTKRPFASNTKFLSTSLNSIPGGSGRSKTSSTSSLKTLPSGLNWPGGNGYFFSMSTNGGKPITYFIRYDD